ncbi:tetratricopeptide repeat protein [Croceivirga thetidis]|uniref:Tetratricopeptide repeat protein n=1 Tax=Croceivirga thetidis TaxID=2721623 RepID=A0ABX1GPL5_9FLAO|nr:hypothetical protein [Croceivirga thetidis]NKI31876.1 hypothetical protein [Croceivirga thetidis]
MKSFKQNTYLLFAIFLLVSITILLNEKKKSSERQLASLNFMKCTVANFMLEAVDSTQQIAPIFEGLGNHHLKISTDEPDCQMFFDQGLKLTYAFNHAEAHRSFLEASRLDPSSPMTYWGQAYALGPNINDPIPDSKRRIKANEAALKALKHVSKADSKEKALIEALSVRYSADTTIDLNILDERYMEAMQKVVKKFPDDTDILTLFAASVMNTTRWNYWNESNEPMNGIAEAKKGLEKAIKINPKNPGAHHYYIHMVELPNPDLAVQSADSLGNLMPSAGHIVHMPSHIYIRVGRYLDAVKVNQKAILADEDYISQCYAQGMYPLAYYPHNVHFLWSAASLLGHSEIAIDAAKKTAEKVPVGEMKDLHFLQNFAATPLLSYVRFGKWNDILTTPPPNQEIKHLRLIWHYARGVAFAKKENLKEAKEELEAIEAMLLDDDLKNMMAVGFDSSHTIATLASEIVSGEIALMEARFDEAISHFKNAVHIEDSLVYNEPSAWYIPPRQNLGTALLKAERYDEAESTFKEDLAELRQNGWSLTGLYLSLEKQGKLEEANQIRQELKKAMEHSDLEITAAVF